ncbi:MAG: RagB/SusD family nutrient uptake outer membrane protein [Hymenobacter sp.]
MYGNVPFVTEADAPSKNLPKQISRADLFAYVETELKAVEPLLAPAHRAPTAEPTRARPGHCWLSSTSTREVYVGTDRNTDCLTYCNKILATDYKLAPEYRLLFLADNNVASASEIIFPITADGLTAQGYGGTTYLVHASIGGSMVSSNFGVNGGWAGNRSRKNLPNLFANADDKRSMFFTNGQTLAIKDLTDFTNGYAVTKWKNVTSTGKPGSDPTGTFVDTDFPLFRLGDVYLMYAEAVLRGGAGGTQAQALTYVNALRDRAYGNQSGRITAADLTAPDFILNERGRELYWEASRRTDLVRFGKYTSASYLWPWKGGATQDGAGIADTRSIFPLPSTDLVANPTLKQNPGY